MEKFLMSGLLALFLGINALAMESTTLSPEISDIYVVCRKGRDALTKFNNKYNNLQNCQENVRDDLQRDLIEITNLAFNLHLGMFKWSIKPEQCASLFEDISNTTKKVFLQMRDDKNDFVVVFAKNILETGWAIWNNFGNETTQLLRETSKLPIKLPAPPAISLRISAEYHFCHNALTMFNYEYNNLQNCQAGARDELQQDLINITKLAFKLYIKMNEYSKESLPSNDIEQCRSLFNGISNTTKNVFLQMSAEKKDSVVAFAKKILETGWGNWNNNKEETTLLLWDIVHSNPIKLPASPVKLPTKLPASPVKLPTKLPAPPAISPQISDVYQQGKDALTKFNNEYNNLQNCQAGAIDKLKQDLINITKLASRINRNMGWCYSKLSPNDIEHCSILFNGISNTTKNVFLQMSAKKEDYSVVAFAKEILETGWDSWNKVESETTQLLKGISKRMPPPNFSSFSDPDVDIIKEKITVIVGYNKQQNQEVFNNLSNPEKYEDTKNMLVKKAENKRSVASYEYGAFNEKPRPQSWESQGGLEYTSDEARLYDWNNARLSNTVDVWNEALFVIENIEKGIYHRYINKFD